VLPRLAPDVFQISKKKSGISRYGKRNRGALSIFHEVEKNNTAFRFFAIAVTTLSQINLDH
jgi:hypothetical protein